ncbi:DoxX family membrane protein [Flavihumibacter profundi]|jgi:putative oxidoreductase|uniref:DoxX family membrane protein n=1 Tax=Flavihumibacter profundi TaxID=2716883 RepID=UPI001CC40313|nr:DoxX family membrane protein [Flavihumibacter profundi]MBZ5855990.1 DoxX family membrane protein [Flavihumibacter profundi]
MNLLHRIELWGDRHHPRWMDIVRIALGLFLCIKGVEFVYNMSSLLGAVNSKLPLPAFAMVLLGHYVFVAHLLGGILLILGAYTRIASLIQVPILLGAVFFVNASRELWRPFPELIVSLIVLFLLVYFVIAGDGHWSIEADQPVK